MEVGAALAESEVTVADLEASGVLRREGDRLALDFTLLTTADLDLVNAVSRREAQSLADAFLAKRGNLETLLAAYDVPSVDRGVVAYILLGCFALDWDGLDLTAAYGYRATARAFPAGDYLLSARQTGGLSLQRLYWGSHNRRGDGYVLTSFGDHFSLPRKAFPTCWGGWPARCGPPIRPKGSTKKLLAHEVLGFGVLSSTR